MVLVYLDEIHIEHCRVAPIEQVISIGIQLMKYCKLQASYYLVHSYLPTHLARWDQQQSFKPKLGDPPRGTTFTATSLIGRDPRAKARCIWTKGGKQASPSHGQHSWRCRPTTSVHQLFSVSLMSASSYILIDSTNNEGDGVDIFRAREQVQLDRTRQLQKDSSQGIVLTLHNAAINDLMMKHGDPVSINTNRHWIPVR